MRSCGADEELRGRAPRVGAAAAPGAVRGADRSPRRSARPRRSPAPPRSPGAHPLQGHLHIQVPPPPEHRHPPTPGTPSPWTPARPHNRGRSERATPAGPGSLGRAAPRAPVGARAALGVRGPRLPRPPAAVPGAQSSARTPAFVPAPFPAEGGGALGWRPRAVPGCPTGFPAWQAQPPLALCAPPGFCCPPGSQRGSSLRWGPPPPQPRWHRAMFPRQAPLVGRAPSHAPRGHRQTLSLLGKAVGSSGQLGDLPPRPVSHTLSLCTDNLWSDQSLETDPDLPPGWRKICDSLGTYYWHVPTGTTQWQHPARTTSPGGHTEDDGEETLQGRECQAPAAKHLAKGRPIPSPMASLSRRHSLSWHGDDFQQSTEPGSKCFAVRSLGWVEIPEEDLAPGKSSIAVNNCIQQLSNSKGQGSAENQSEGQDLVMILKKDTMSLVDPLDRSLIHRQPILNIRVWGVGCNNGRDRDFAFVASDKDTCVLKCHVFHCNVPAKGIAKALHEMCSKIVAERAVASNRLARAATLDPISAEDLPLQVDILEAVRQSMQTYEALYIGTLPVPRAMGMDVLNEAIEKLTRRPGRENWTPSLIYVSDTAMRVHPAQEPEEAEHIWECQVRYVTFLGVGRDAHTFALIVDTGRRFQCAAFWCEPDAGTISEAVQAACMVQYQKCLVAAAPGTKAKSTAGRGRAGPAAAGDAARGAAKAGGGGGGAGAGARKRGLFSFLEVFRLRRALLHSP